MPHPDLSTPLSGWLSWLEQLHPRSIELGLDRVAQVADMLAVRHWPVPVITVTGTNGKGSTCAFLSHILQAAGYRVATYTSPHLLQFNERICIDLQPVTDADIVRALQAVNVARGAVSLTYFEFTTLAALWLFRAAQPDVLVLEVGLGGRLDAVNIVAADVAVVTSIALDHQDWLGATREAIGYEKAGIFRAEKYAVIGERDVPETMLQQAQLLSARVVRKGRDFDRVLHQDYWQCRLPGGENWRLPLPQLPVENAATALAALWHCALPITEQAVQQGLRSALLMGRCQRLFYQSRELVLDVAHNPHGIAFFMERLRELAAGRRIVAVFAQLLDKELPGSLLPALPWVAQWYVAPLPGPRGRSGLEIEAALQQAGACVQCAGSVLQALAAAITATTENDIIAVFGSFHTIGPVLRRVLPAHNDSANE